MRRRTSWIVGAGLAVAMGGGLVAAAVASDGDDDQEVTGATRDRAVAGAPGRHRRDRPGDRGGDDGAAYGVEVRLDDGRQVEIGLDKDFKVVGREPDEDRPDEGADR
jgi:hypothetical protein